MKKVFKWIFGILLSVLSLIIIVLIGFYIAFFFWKKDVLQDLPQDSQVISTEQGEVEYRLLGDSDLHMLMIHGSPGSVHVSQGEYFVDKGFSVLGVSRPGYYRTPLSSGGSPKEEAALYNSLLDKLNIDSVYVNGISGGGPVSIQFAIDYPERCAGLILSAAISEKIEESTNDGLISSFFRTEFGTWLGIQIGKTQFSEEEAEKIEWFTKRGFFPFEYTANGMTNDTYEFNHLQDLEMEKILSPTILFHGNKDVNVPINHSQNASKRIPNSTLIEMDGKDHFVFFMAYSDTINQQIVDFVNKLEAK